MADYPQSGKKEFEKPWRLVTWGSSAKVSMLEELQHCSPSVESLRILIHGPVGAGKSSFINSVNSALQGNIRQSALVDALVDAVSGESFTKQLRTHKLKKSGTRSYHPFQFSDIMGLEQDKLDGVHTKDIIKILQGKVKSGYKFNPLSPIDETSKLHNPEPTLANKIHCLVSVLPADKISVISEDVIHKMKEVRKYARDLGIPQVIVMSMVDKSCPLVSKDLTKMYDSKKIKEKMQECSDRLGVPMNCIFPVKNYHEEISTDINMDTLILMAMTSIVRFASDFVDDQLCPD